MRSDYKVYRYDRLDAPVVTAGSAAVLIGAQNGLFPDMGYAVPGEMGGLWAGEKKICDGFFLAVDDVPLTQADACEIHPVVTAFHYRMQKERLHVVRRQFIPDGVSGCVIELTLSQRQRDQAFQLSRAGELRKIQRRAGGAFGGQPGVHAPDEDPPPQDGRRHRAQFLLPRNAIRILGARAPRKGIYEQAGYRRAV